jgi:hypothetical protein
MRKINYSKVRRSAQEDLKKYERFGIKVFKAALKLQAKPNPSPLPMQEAYITFYQKVFVDSAKKEFDRIRQDNKEKAFVPSDFFLNTWREWIKDWVLQNLGNLITGVNDNTLEQIQKILGEGIEQGLNPFQLERLLLQEIPNIARARAIARTESTRAYNEGKKRSADDWAKQTGTQLWKLWIHGGAREPRFQHIQAQDKPIRADQPFVFTTKGVEVFMDKPGDQKGGAAQTVNCSCVVVYVSEAYARRNFPNTFVGLPPLTRPAAPFAPPVIPQQLQGFRYATTLKEAKKISVDIINNNTVLKVKKAVFSQEVTLEKLNRLNEQLNKLSLEYKLSPQLNEKSQIDLLYKSNKKTLGVVKPGWEQLRSVNFGSKSIGKSSTQRFEIIDGIKKYSFNAKTDLDKNDLYVLTHEFAHVISVESHVKFNSIKYPEIKLYWDELRNIKTKYLAETKKLGLNGDYESLNEIYLGSYASTNASEFMAEAFTEYKLNSNPSKYAIEVGQLIDKYFKK